MEKTFQAIIESELFKPIGCYLLFLVFLCICMYIAKRTKNVSFNMWNKFFVLCVVNFIIVSAVLISKYLLFLLIIIAFIEIISSYAKSKTNTMLFFIVSIFLFGIIAYQYIMSVLIFDTIALIKVYLAVNVFDGCSQTFGVLCGKHKILPQISPNKTIEGTIGGCLGVFVFIILPYISIFSFLLGLLICITSFLGDMLASLYKRKMGLKDFNNIIPEHGGILDRFDSFIFTLGVINLIYYIS